MTSHGNVRDASIYGGCKGGVTIRNKTSYDTFHSGVEAEAA